jgi:hypothetical protein
MRPTAACKTTMKQKSHGKDARRDRTRANEEIVVVEKEIRLVGGVPAWRPISAESFNRRFC